MLVAALILALALLVFGIVGTIKIAAWLVLFVILAAVVLAVAAAYSRRSRRSGGLRRSY